MTTVASAAIFRYESKGSGFNANDVLKDLNSTDNHQNTEVHALVTTSSPESLCF